MHEAIDYNALSWVRNELGEILNQARLHLEEYATDSENERLLQQCATQLHEALGPLQMVDIKGAVLLITEMEEVVADLLQGTVEQTETALELLMQAFLQLPDYLSSLRSGRPDRPQVLLPLINSLRATRGEQPLQQTAIFSPNLSVRVPDSVFDVRAEPVRQDVAAVARAARIQFQAGLLDWYRDAGSGSGLQSIIDVLDELQHCAGSEPVARIWWAGSGVATALRDGLLEETLETKQLFGQLDRQIKRMLDSGEGVFDDVLSDDLMKNLLFRVAQASGESEIINAIRSTYGLKQISADSDAAWQDDDGPVTCNEDMLATVAPTIHADIERIKEQLDTYIKSDGSDLQLLAPVADSLHVLANTLDMVGLDAHAGSVAGEEMKIRDIVSRSATPDESGFSALANQLVAVEDTLGGISADDESSVFREGQDAVTREVVASMGRAKEAISDFIKASGDCEPLSVVPELLNQVAGGLTLVSQERAAVATEQVKNFIAHELIENNQSLEEDQLDSLADAICSIEFYIEEIAENRNHAGAALDIAEQSMAKLGYPCPRVDSAAEPLPAVDAAGASVESSATAGHSAVAAEAEISSPVEAEVRQPVAAVPAITEMQVIAPDADEEILEIFIEEAEEELEKLASLVPMWLATPDPDYLADIRRSFHTLKGSGRMVGAFALGELAWNLENLVNRITDNTVEMCAAIEPVLTGSVDALVQLLAQVKGKEAQTAVDVDDLSRLACRFSDPAATMEDEVAGDTAEAAPADEVLAGQYSTADLPVLSADADAEIVEIFVEEATEEITSLTATVPAWVGQPDDEDALATMRRSLHTLKGSGRMAGAMLLGEYSWCVENLLNRVIEGHVIANDAIRAFLGTVPDTLAQLLEQVQGKDVADLDTNTMMQQADALSRGEVSGEQVSAADEVITAGEEEPSLFEIFRNECGDLLQNIEEFLAAGDEPRVVSEPLYRALHTLSGISESAEIVSITALTGDLNNYFDEYFHARQILGQEAIEILRASVPLITEAVQQLPDLSVDEAQQQLLRDRIAALPRIEAGSEEPVDTAATVDSSAVPNADQEAGADPFADMDEELYEIFIEETAEIIDSSEVVLRSWSEQPDNTEYVTEFQRQLHTIKGGARMMDIQAIGDLSHVLESLVTRIVDGVIATSSELFSLLQESHDRLSEMLEEVKNRKMPATAKELEVRLDSLWNADVKAAGAESGSREESGQQPAPCADPVAERNDSVELADSDEVAGSGETVPEQGITESQYVPTQEQLTLPEKVQRKSRKRAQGEQVRVQSHLLDDMVNYAGEINIYRSRMEQQVSDYRFNLTELDQTITRLRGQLRQLEMETEAQILYRFEQEVDSGNQDFDPLEMDRYSNLQQLSRSLIESISDLRSIQDLMDDTTRSSETLLLQQSRVSTDLQEGLMRTRMIPFSGLSSRLRRIVRQSARQLGKKVELELVGADGEMDRTVIDRIIAPLEHMLRNAISHGIEMPDLREESGKPAAGTITISFDREGPEIVLRIADDGAGLDTDAIRARALERGLMSADDQLSDNAALQFILQTGFSTATEVTQISGRGVGMDVVSSEVKQLGGSLHIESTTGVGTTFTVRLPYTLAVNQALLVTAGSESFCVPLGSVEGVVRANGAELAECYSSEDNIYNYAGSEYELKHLATLLNTGTIELGKNQEQVPVLLLRIGERRIALQVESLMGSREIVIKPVGAQLTTVDCISGATILGDGSVVMILDMAAVARMNVRAEFPEVPVAEEEEGRLVVMVVDDSITVRKVTSRLLERNGFKVLTAKDGVDAMGQLQEVVPDMMLLDIEMPRMDGFELATHMRNDDRQKHVPIIMITSRTGEKHRARAQQIGVNNYLGKPYQENDLLDSIYRIIGIPEDGAEA